MTSRLGLHWIRVHPDGRDLDHIGRMQYKSAKLFEWHWSDRDACNNLLAALPQDAYLLARDHPMSEQKQDMFRDPINTGSRHADEWASKVRDGRVHLPTDRTFFLGINEPDATTGDRNAIDLYTESFLSHLAKHGLRGGAFNFSTGHPRTRDGSPATPADYSVFERSRQAIVRGHHIAVLHIYGTAAVPCVPGHYDRLKACDWQDVTWIVGECGADEHVIGGGAHDGYLRTLGASDAYCRWLDDFILGINDWRIHSYQVFSYDFSHPWDSFDIRPIRDHLQNYRWQHMVHVPDKHTTHLPILGSGPEPVSKPSIVYVTAPSGLNLRATPNGDILTAIPYGDAVTVTGVASVNGWLRATYQGHTGWLAAGYVSASPPAPLPPKEPPTQPGNEEEAFQRCLAWILRWEGLWADDPNDPGGATMRGITIGTYTRWRQAHGQPAPSKDDLRNISLEEVARIYREWYWLESGANRQPWPMCLAMMNIAVNAGPERAKQFYAQSGDNFLRFMAIALDWYTTISGWKHYSVAWTRRNADVLREASQ